MDQIRRAKDKDKITVSTDTGVRVTESSPTEETIQGARMNDLLPIQETIQGARMNDLLPIQETIQGAGAAVLSPTEETYRESLASSERKAKSEGAITPASEENLKLDDDSSKASMASSESKAKPESDVTPASEGTWHFDDDTSKGLLLADVLRERPGLIEKLALCLDRKMRLIPNWKHLSQELNVDAAVISSLEEYSDFSPTIRLFDCLEVTQPDLTIQQLKQALAEIKRIDVSHLLTTKGCTDSHLVKEVITSRDIQSTSPHAGLLDAIALALDTKSKIRKNWSNLARQLGVPSETFNLFERRSTTDPTSGLFEYLAVHCPQMTLKTLTEALVKITRKDLISIFKAGNLDDEDLLTDLMTSGSELLQTVAAKLNVEQVPGVQNWRQLADRLGIPHGVYREFDRTEPRKSPTTEVLQWLTAQSPDITFIDVVNALNKIQRNDAIQIITKQFSGTVGYTRVT